MKRHHIGLIVAVLVGAPARAAQFNAVEALRPLPIMPVLPMTLPGRQLPIPNAIPGPLIQLPGPTIPLVSIPGVIQVQPFVPAQPARKGFFPAAQKMFAAAPGQKVSEQKLNAAFDGGAKASAPAVAASGDGSVEVKDDQKKKDAPKRQPVKRPGVIGVPTLELEREIGI